ncbi:MAG: hypothetical protein JNJ90_01425 [Saprospiraceae bacterium]|nr:hypothetical protein [Saprospiraceae bacterium]
MLQLLRVIALLVSIFPNQSTSQPINQSTSQPNDTFSLLFTLPVVARFATADNLGNVYLITTQNALEKYAPDGRLLTRYSNNRLGSATWLDVSNPQKVLAWYADFRTVVVLDRSLTVLGELNLIGAGYPEVRTVAAAADGNLWLYDEVAFQLKKITPEGNVLFQSQALNMIQAERVSVSAIRDDGTQVLASDPVLGMMLFDVYGQYQRSLPWPGISTFVLEQNRLEYLTDTALHIEDLQVFVARDIPLPESAKSPDARVWAAPNRLFVQRGAATEIEVWRRE